MRYLRLSIAALSALFFFLAPSLVMADTQSAKFPVPDTVTMVDLGAKTCIPCKMMAPILAELEKEYQGRAAIFFIDVWEDTDTASELEIAAIPTQIFYDRQGKEVWRHAGFLDKKAIREKLDALLQK